MVFRLNMSNICSTPSLTKYNRFLLCDFNQQAGLSVSLPVRRVMNTWSTMLPGNKLVFDCYHQLLEFPPGAFRRWMCHFITAKTFSLSVCKQRCMPSVSCALPATWGFGTLGKYVLLLHSSLQLNAQNLTHVSQSITRKCEYSVIHFHCVSK